MDLKRHLTYFLSRSLYQVKVHAPLDWTNPECLTVFD